MAMRLLLSLFVGLVPLLVAEVCDTGDVACAARAGALLQRKSRQQQAPVSTGEESLYGSGSMMIEGKFHYVYDPQQYLGKSEDELLRAQEAIQEALAESVGFGLVAAEIQVRFDLAAALAQVSNATPTTLDMVCTFTFPCPAGATPEEVTTSMRTITTRSFLSILAPKLAGLGHEPFAFTATAFMGAAVVTTASPSPTNSTTSFIPIASTLPATTTTEAPKMDFHPCKSLEDYMPEAKMSEYGWCNVEGKTTPSESECLAANCSAHGYPDHPHCHCATEEGCALIGSTWKYHLCKEEMRMYQQGEIYTLWEEAKALGTCNGVVTSWHSTLPESMDWPARKCCASWPQTFCDPADTLATPCKDASDFLADHVTDDGVTCMDWLQQWWSEYWALKNASAAGSCSGMDLPWGESLQDWVTHPAKQCCASFPATICDKDAKFMTPCKVAADFMPEQELYSYCDFEPKLDNVTCEATGCTYYQEWQWCGCPEEVCAPAGGVWKMHTCAAELSYWPLKMHRALQEAAEGGSCADLEYEGDLQGETQWVSQKCCASFPASVCNPTAKKMTPCKDEADFLPGNFLHEWCEFHGTVPETCATTKGCHAGEGWCHCDNSEACTAAGGAWNQRTCDAAVQEWDSEKHLAVQSAATGSCEDVDWHGQPMSVALQHESSRCCASYPASVCDPTAKKMTPCKDEADFMPSNVLHEWCEVNPIPNASTCASHGCHGDGSYCHCSSHSSCASLGGSWKTSTCAEDLGHKDVAWHQAVAQASDEGTCAESRVHDSTVEDAISWSSRKCCSSYPANACYKGLKKMTPCKDEADFLPGNILEEWCKFHGTVPETCATTKGCHAGEGWCYCDNHEACTALGGALNQQTCDMGVQEWEPAKHKALQEAYENGACGVDSKYGDLVMMIDHPARQCCASFPASVCNPTAKKMTPCKDEADFIPTNVLHEWCEVNPSPNASTCASHGCHGDGSYCHCSSHSSCASLGGSWKTSTCAEDLGHKDVAWHQAVAQASDEGTCAESRVHDSTVEDAISWSSRKCCSSYPANACYKGLKKMTPCKDEADFLPGNFLHEWCEFHGTVPETCATTKGCHAGEGWCHCDNSEACTAAGGAWKQWTCDAAVQEWDSEKHLAVQSAATGSCEDVDWHGQPMSVALQHESSKCCASYPAFVCDPTAKKMTPCKDEADFMPSNVVHEYCELHGVSVDSDTCTAHGCRSNHGHCHCDSQPGCEGVGGTWKVTSCEMEIGYWEPAKHKALQEAEESGTCGVDNMYGDLAIMIDHAATKCCASFPATLCDKTARHMTPCKDDADYTPEKEMYAWCDFYGDGAVLPEETVCNAQEGCYGGQGWCHCDGATGCQATGGIWNAHTCAKEVSQWSPEQHKMLQKADEHGTCLDLEVHGMRAQDFVNWPAQQCCKSFPASICDKDVKAMTPCLRSQDFDHNKTMWAWCEGLYPVPAEADCLAQGCTGNEHHCHCETAAACTALGGKYVEHQCWQDLQWMAAEVHKGIAKAIGQGTCEDVEAQHGKLEYAVDWLGSSCCASGMSVCQELATGGSLY